MPTRSNRDISSSNRYVGLIKFSTCRRYLALSAIVLVSILVKFSNAFDTFEHTEAPVKHSGPLPKDKILFSDVKKLTFYRHKRTSSRRTHSIPQLSCVGGSAGCKLFTPNEVECEKLNYDQDRQTHNWKCSAELSDRVKINNVEVICEGYEYPEDDYILLGSCGLEFTLDYSDPNDYHDHSYYKHMDEHEKQMHRAKIENELKSKEASWRLQSILVNIYEDTRLLAIVIILALFALLVVKFFFFKSSQSQVKKKGTLQRVSSYGPLTSAVLSTKKAC